MIPTLQHEDIFKVKSNPREDGHPHIAMSSCCIHASTISRVRDGSPESRDERRELRDESRGSRVKGIAANVSVHSKPP